GSNAGAILAGAAAIAQAGGAIIASAGGDLCESVSHGLMLAER
ncbi:MAG: hypothetical protein RLZ51_915, partial [Pseudomonadota bacterium]